MRDSDTSPQTHRPPAAAPVVSVIIPAYNVAQYIGAALDSVDAQTFTDYEVIVVNDGSPDTAELERVLAPYRERIVYITQENRGLSGARNTGIRAARAPLIALLDSDDIWEPDYLAVQVALMERDPTIDVLYPNAVIFGDTPVAGREFMDWCPSRGEVTFESLLTEQCQVMVSVTARRETIMRAGMFDESLRSVEDFDLWLRIAKQGGRIAYHRRVLARYRIRRGSLSSDWVWMSKHLLHVLEKVERTMDLTPAERRLVAQRRAHYGARLRLDEGRKAFFSGDTKAAIVNMSEANDFFKSRKIALAVFFIRFAPRLVLRAYDLRDRLIFKMSTRP